MRLLAIISGEYGQRHVDNIRSHGPKEWTVDVWRAPAVLPPVIDYPEAVSYTHLRAHET